LEGVKYFLKATGRARCPPTDYNISIVDLKQIIQSRYKKKGNYKRGMVSIHVSMSCE
jgi:hypothetical protein